MTYEEIRQARALLESWGLSKDEQADVLLRLFHQTLDALEAKMDMQTSEASFAAPHLSERDKVFIGGMVRQRDEAVKEKNALLDEFKTLLAAMEYEWKHGDGIFRTTKAAMERAQKAVGTWRPCPSTYTHSTHGKLACEKDEAHLHRRYDVEHENGDQKWMSV